MSICKTFNDQVKVAFCEAPYLSTSIWNQSKSQTLRDKFLADDSLIEQKIDHWNISLQELNRQNGSRMPQFALDMKKSRKSNQSYNSRKISLSLLKDGIHPDTLLSTYWLRRLINVVVVQHCLSK